MSASEPNVRVSNTLSEEALAQAAALPEPGDVLNGHRIVEKLTSGGFGTVFLADNLGLPGQNTVVKCMPLGQLSEREADVLRHIDHPMVVKVLAVGRTEHFQYIVMEYLKGETLDALLGKYHQFGPIQAVRIGLRIADALEAVHEKGLVHRDLKPANIMLKLAKDQGKFVDWLKLIDFGLARDRGHELTIAEGTPEYVAPETLQQQPVTPSSDLYALGVILHEMLTGQRPYQASSVNVMVSQHVNAAVPHVRDSVPDIGVDLDELVFALMSKEPAKRPGSASEVAKRLARLERELSDGSTGINVHQAVDSGLLLTVPMAMPVPAPAPIKLSNRASAEPTPLLLPLRLQQRRRWPWVVAAVVLLLLLWLMLRWGPGGPTPQSVVVSPKPVVGPIEVAAAVVPPVAVEPVVTKPVELEPLDDLKTLNPIAAKPQPLIVKRPKTSLEIVGPDCTPDEQWKKNMNADLSEIGKKVAVNDAQDAIFQENEGPLSRRIRDASSGTDCAAANKMMSTLKLKLRIQ